MQGFINGDTQIGNHFNGNHYRVAVKRNASYMGICDELWERHHRGGGIKNIAGTVRTQQIRFVVNCGTEIYSNSRSGY